MYRMKILSERKVKSAEAERYFFRVFTGPDTKALGQTNERAMAKALNLFEGRGRGAELDSAKGTAFGLLNAVTEFADHERRARSTDHRLESAWFGQGAAIKYQALLRAEQKAQRQPPIARAVLVTERALPDDLQNLADLLGVVVYIVAINI
jgi:hypothetical protein